MEALRTGGAKRDGLDAELTHQRSLLQNMESDQETAREKRVHWQVEEAQVSARDLTGPSYNTSVEAFNSSIAAISSAV